MPLRSFSLNDPQAYEALCQGADRPWIPNGALPQEPRGWSAVSVMAESEAEAGEAFAEWERHVDAGRISGGR